MSDPKVDLTEKWYAATDGEHFTSDAYDTREACVADFPRENDLDPGDRFTVGRSFPVSIRTPDADDLIERMTEHMGDQVPYEYVEGWLAVKPDVAAELTAAVRATVMDWIERHKLMPTFWRIVDESEHIVPGLPAEAPHE